MIDYSEAVTDNINNNGIANCHVVEEVMDAYGNAMSAQSAQKAATNQQYATL